MELGLVVFEKIKYVWHKNGGFRFQGFRFQGFRFQVSRFQVSGFRFQGFKVSGFKVYGTCGGFENVFQN
jgi:hypothetical protein